MAERQELELSIASADDGEIASIVDGLGAVEVTRPRQARTLDPITLLTVAGSAVGLVNQLLDLRDRLRQRTSSPDVSVQNEQGKSISLETADAESITDLLKPGAHNGAG